VILKANGKGFCGGHVARWGPDENPYPAFGNTFEDLYKGTADLFLWPTLYLWEFPKPTISQIHGYCMGGGIYLGLLTDFSVASDGAYFQMPLAQSLGEPGGHTMIEPWLMMNWHRWTVCSSSSAGTSIWRARSLMVSPCMTAPRSISSSGRRRFLSGLAPETYLPT
jgi:Enoyl-CoA hydratase/isomerase